MNDQANRLLRRAVVFAPVSLTAFGRAPSFDILGSFFPAWLVCFVAAILLTVISRALLRRHVEMAWPALVYPSLTALFAFSLWLGLFG